MDLELSVDQQATVDLARSLVQRRFALDRVRRREERDDAVDPDDWRALGEAGVFSLALSEDRGGAGLGLTDAALVLAELGRGLVPGPVAATTLAARVVDGAVGEGAAAGTAIVALARRPQAGTGPLLVPHRAQLEALLVAEPDGSLGLVEGRHLPEGEPVVSIDPLTPHRLVAELPPADPLGAPAAHWGREWRLLCAALLAGMAGATCDLAVAYAKERHQFGRPIGAFQAVKHLCADMLVRAETARAAVDVAGLTADQPGTGDPARAAASAALVSAEAALANAKACIQVHGGMGYTWEVPAHLYLVRARVIAGSLGPLDGLAREVAARW